MLVGIVCRNVASSRVALSREKLLRDSARHPVADNLRCLAIIVSDLSIFGGLRGAVAFQDARCFGDHFRVEFLDGRDDRTAGREAVDFIELDARRGKEVYLAGESSCVNSSNASSAPGRLLTRNHALVSQT